jgi:hypothetical protein
LRRADHSSRGVLPSVMCLVECVHESSTKRRPRPTRAVVPRGGTDVVTSARRQVLLNEFYSILDAAPFVKLEGYVGKGVIS